MGWKFRTRHKNWVTYYYVNIADFDEAESAVKEEMGASKIEGHVTLADDVFELMGISKGSVGRGVVQ